jgi:hypothetical protein
MAKYVFENQNLHLITRFLVVFLIAPYMIYRGHQKRDQFMQLLGVLLLVFDVLSLTVLNKNTPAEIHQFARAAALLVQVTYMAIFSVRHRDWFMGGLTVGTFAADAWTFYLGLKKNK